MLSAIIPKALKMRVKHWISWIVEDRLADTPVLKYDPYMPRETCYAIPKRPNQDYDKCSSGLPIPPPSLWLRYGNTQEQYLNSGKRHTEAMLELVKLSGFSLVEGSRILDFGCGSGRMIRHLNHLTDSCEIWGTDISAECIYWCKQYLSPTFHCATTTTIPHLPFEDRYFNLIYCGSVFTHIDDLADAWLLELRRVLSPQGRLYLTIHDQHTSELLDGPQRDERLAGYMKSHEIYNQMRNTSAMLVVGRDSSSQVFYDIEYFRRHLSHIYDVLSITEEAYGYQTAILVTRK